MNKMREKMFLCFLCGSMVLGCQEPYTATRDSEQKRVIRQGPVTIPILNEHLSEAKLVFFTDIATNITTVVYEGQVWAVSKSHSGSLRSPTSPGIYTVHLIDFCAPWYSGITDKQQEECSSENRLGMFVFWYKGKHNFGVHTRDPKDSKIEFSKYSSAKSRSDRTDGCIVAPHELLEKILFELILTDPAFLVPDKSDKDKEDKLDLHPAAKAMKQYKEDGTKKNVAIRLIDFEEETITVVKGEKGDPVPFDMRVVVIDSSHKDWVKLKQQKDFKENQNIFRFFDPKFFDPEKDKKIFYKIAKNHHEMSYSAVTNCTAQKDIPIFKSNESFNPGDIMSTIEKGTQLKKVHLWPVNKMNTPVKLELRDVHSSVARSGWIQNLDGLQCSKDIYWSSKKDHIEFKK